MERKGKNKGRYIFFNSYHSLYPDPLNHSEWTTCSLLLLNHKQPKQAYTSRTLHLLFPFLRMLHSQRLAWFSSFTSFEFLIIIVSLIVGCFILFYSLKFLLMNFSIFFYLLPYNKEIALLFHSYNHGHNSVKFMISWQKDYKSPTLES